MNSTRMVAAFLMAASALALSSSSDDSGSSSTGCATQTLAPAPPTTGEMFTSFSIAYSFIDAASSYIQSWGTSSHSTMNTEAIGSEDEQVWQVYESMNGPLMGVDEFPSVVYHIPANEVSNYVSALQTLEFKLVSLLTLTSAKYSEILAENENLKVANQLNMHADGVSLILSSYYDAFDSEAPCEQFSSLSSIFDVLKYNYWSAQSLFYGNTNQMATTDSLPPATACLNYCTASSTVGGSSSSAASSSASSSSASSAASSSTSSSSASSAASGASSTGCETLAPAPPATGTFFSSVDAAISAMESEMSWLQAWDPSTEATTASNYGEEWNGVNDVVNSFALLFDDSPETLGANEFKTYIVAYQSLQATLINYLAILDSSYPKFKFLNEDGDVAQFVDLHGQYLRQEKDQFYDQWFSSDSPCDQIQSFSSIVMIASSSISSALIVYGFEESYASDFMEPPPSSIPCSNYCTMSSTYSTDSSSTTSSSDASSSAETTSSASPSLAAVASTSSSDASSSAEITSSASLSLAAVTSTITGSTSFIDARSSASTSAESTSYENTTLVNVNTTSSLGPTSTAASSAFSSSSLAGFSSLSTGNISSALVPLTPPTSTLVNVTSAQNLGSTTVVTKFTTYCPELTTFEVNGKKYTVTEATTLTITDCPCTLTSVPTSTDTITVLTTYCPGPTTFEHNGKTYTVTAATTLTIPIATTAGGGAAPVATVEPVESDSGVVPSNGATGLVAGIAALIAGMAVSIL